MLNCCIRLLWYWSFCLYHYIIYICCFGTSYLLLLWYGWSLRRCFVQWLEEIQFHSWGFLFFKSLPVFHTGVYWWYFPWTLRDSRSPQVSRTLLPILADLNNTAVLLVSIHPSIFHSSNSISKHLGAVLSFDIYNR